MIKSQETEKASDVLRSLEELAAQAKGMASNLAYAASKSREAGNISTRLYDDILDLVTIFFLEYGIVQSFHQVIGSLIVRDDN